MRWLLSSWQGLRAGPRLALLHLCRGGFSRLWRPQNSLNSAAVYSAFLFHGGRLGCATQLRSRRTQPADAPGAASAQLQSGLLVGLVIRHRRSAVVVMQSGDATCCWRIAGSTCARWAACQGAAVAENRSTMAFQTPQAQGGFSRAAWAPSTVWPLAGTLSASGAFRTKVRPSMPF